VSAWYDDRTNLAAVARHMGERGDGVEDVAYMIEKPWKFEDDWQELDDADTRPRVEASAGLAVSSAPQMWTCPDCEGEFPASRVVRDV
jgi:hypothetical protein